MHDVACEFACAVRMRKTISANVLFNYRNPYTQVSSVQTYVLQSSCELNPLSHSFLRVTPSLTLISVLLGDISPSVAFAKKVRFTLFLHSRKQNFTFSNGNRTEWSPIRSVIIRVATKSDHRAAGVRFVYHEYDYRPNWTTRSPIIN